MLKPDTDTISLRMENIWRDAELRIMEDVIRRIKKTGQITSTADYQINRLIEMGKTSEEVEKIIKDSLNKTWPEMFNLYDDVAEWQYVRNEDIYLQVNGNFIPPEDNEWLKQVSAAVKQQTKDELINLAQSYGFSLIIGNKRTFTPFAQYYQQYVDTAIMDLLSGGFDYNTVIRRTVTQMTNSGLRFVNYSTGRSNRVDVAVRRSVMTGLSQITSQINERSAAELGTNYFEVDWHAGARPEHRVWQGKVYIYKELQAVCGLGTVTGLCGANCRHTYYPFVPGASERMYSDEWLKEQNRKEAQTKIWNGKEYDVYGQTQKQRQMETAMRAQREKVDLLKEAGADKDDITIARCKYQAQLNEYKRFCKKMGLKEQRERIYYDKRGRVAPSQKTYRNYLKEDDLSKNAIKSIARNGKNDIIKINAEPGTSKYRKLKKEAIIKKGSEIRNPVFTDDAFGKLAIKIPKKSGYYDVIMHGAPKTVEFFGERTDAKTIAEILKKRKDYNGEPIRLLSCSTGKSDDCFAQRLANELNVIVEAPNDIIWARSDKTYTIGPNKYKNTGKMVKFYPKKR